MLERVKSLAEKPQEKPKTGLDLLGLTPKAFYQGVLNGGIQVFHDPYAPKDKFQVVGFKGKSAMDPGLFYAPYVPHQVINEAHGEEIPEKKLFSERMFGFEKAWAEEVMGYIHNPLESIANKNGRIYPDLEDYRPSIGFKTRYGVVTNPFNKPADPNDPPVDNKYFKKVKIDNLL